MSSWFGVASSVGGKSHKSKRRHSPSPSGFSTSTRASRYGKKVTTGSSFLDYAAGVKKPAIRSTGSYISVDLERDDKDKKHKKVYYDDRKSKSSTSFIFGPQYEYDRRSMYDGRKNRSSASFFSLGSGHSSTSSYRRSPRRGFIARMYKKLKKTLKKLKKYLKSHPLKVFTLVILPLLTSGVFATLFKFFGFRLPPTLTKWISKIMGKPTYGDYMMGGLTAMGTSVTKGGDGRGQFERRRNVSALDNVSGVLNNVGSIMSVAKLFI